ncbi:hypothetical protein ACOBQB_32975 [Streptomyces sp. G5(2025)]|uniref:hypothetical protein n=1 Tax=Streptomyces sp. G5(2025) TaxID=3406628 RepID=UPI003C293452
MTKNGSTTDITSDIRHQKEAGLGEAGLGETGLGETGLGEVVVPEDPDDPTVVGEVSDRRVLAAGAVLLGICAGFIAYGFLGGDERESHSAPTAPVTCRVTDTGAVKAGRPLVIRGEPSAQRE